MSAMREGGAIALRRIVYAMLFGVVVYGGFAVWHGLDSLGSELGRFHWWAFAAACGLALGNYGLRWLKWEFYLSRLQIRGVRRVDSLLTFLSGFVFTVTPGKVGEVFKSIVLFETYAVPIARTAPIVVADRITDVIGVIVLIIVGSAGFSGGWLWAGLGTAAVVLLLGVIGSRSASLWIVGRIERLPGAFRQLGPKLHEAYESLATTVRPANLILPALLSVAAWLLECAALWIILLGLGEHVDLRLATFFYATSTLAGALVPVPGGLGITETSLQGQMQRLGHLGAAVSTAAMILVRLATLWFAVLIGFLALSILRRRYPRLLSAAGSPSPRTLAPTLE